MTPRNKRSFESRKEDHIRLSLDQSHQTTGSGGLEQIHLYHEALPELDFSDIAIQATFFSIDAASPFFISSMTAGHKKGEGLNTTLARAASAGGWPMGVGSQRRELSDKTAALEWKKIRKTAPGATFFSNLGLSQLITSPLENVLRLVDNLEAAALIVHTNPLQEVIQPEGTPQFAGGYKAIEKLCKASPVPIIIKETGCGFSPSTLERLLRTGITAIDISGKGGTHWGRIEGSRAKARSIHQQASQTFKNWGESTVESLLSAVTLRDSLGVNLEIWASGGVRSGLDAAKCLALGAEKVGFAHPALLAAQKGERAVLAWMKQMEFELKVALFCTGSKTPEALRKAKKWRKT